MPFIKTVVEVTKMVYDEQGNLLDVENKPMNPRKQDQRQQIVTERYYLLHWGLQVGVAYDKESNPIPYSQTVAICQHIKTGKVETFIPNDITIVGTERIGK